MQKQIVVLNTTAGASDATLNNQNLVIKNCPVIKLKDIKTVGEGILHSLVETPQSWLVTLTAAANTPYAIQVQQYNRREQRPITEPVRYTSDSAGASGTTIADAIALYINKKTTAGQWNITAVQLSASTISITGGVGDPALTVTAVQNCTVATGTWVGGTYSNGVLTALGSGARVTTIAPNATPGTALAVASGVITVTTAAAHGLIVGQSVNITTATGFTFTRNGVSSVASIANAVIASVPSSTTFTFGNTTLNTVIGNWITGSGTNSGTIVITPLSQSAKGVPADLIAKGALAADATSGATYSTLFIEFEASVNDTNTIGQKQNNTLYLFMNEGMSNYTGAVGTGLVATIQNLLAGLNSSAVANPEVFAVTG